MKKKVLILDNGFKKYKPHIIDAFENNKEIEIKTIYNFVNKDEFSFIEKIFLKIRFPLDSSNFNKRINQSVYDFKPDIIVIIKGNNVYPSTLKKIKDEFKKVIILSWTADNMIKKHNSSWFFEKSISLYDVHFTTKSNIINKLTNLGAKKVIFLNKAYSKYHHFPEEFNKIYDFEVLFIGSAEIDRYNSMKYIADNGINVNIYGNMWDKKYKSSTNLKINRKELVGKSYREAISSSKITLCFLRKINDDLQTDRTMEIPACKGFMLAERTNEHINLFKENEEAAYFESNEELLQKVRFYLSNPNKIDKIKNSGYERAVSSKYSFDDMVKEILNNI